MLNAGREQSVAVEFLGFAVIIKKANAASRRSLDGLVNARGGMLFAGTGVGNREASFLIGIDVVGEITQFRIDEEARLGVFAFAGEVHDSDAQMHANLHSGKSNALGVIHGLEHIVHEALDVFVDFLDRLGALVQERIGKGEDFSDCHGCSLGAEQSDFKAGRS